MPHAQAEVRERILILACPGNAEAHILLDTPAWHAWLASEQVRGFRYCHALGVLTVRKERRARGAWYWSAYRRVDGHLRKWYLGRSSELTAARLEAAALALQRAPDGYRGHDHELGNGQARTLIPTKLMVPLPGVALVMRPRLFSRLDSQCGGRVTMVVAPAGSGKTTLLASWLASRAERVKDEDGRNNGAQPIAAHPAPFTAGWLSLDPADNDPLRFWRYVLAALAPALPALEDEQMALSHVVPDAVGNRAIDAIIRATSARPGPQCTLVLDDYHVITSEQIHGGMARLLGLLPLPLHLVIASRTEPPLPLPRLRVRGLLLDLRAADLAFTLDEATALLRETAPAWPALDVAELTERTEGWAAGLRLVSLSSHGDRGWSKQAPERLFAYLMDEVFHQQPAPIQRFLLVTALPERLCAPLCATLLHAAAAENADTESAQAVAQELLTTLERQGLFLTALDAERRWFRYHHLFREFLRQVLEATGPELVPRIQRNAGRWFAEHDLIGEALPLLLAAGDVEPAADLVESRVERALWEWYDQGVVRAWLHLLPSAVIRARWRLAYADLMTYLSSSPSTIASEAGPRIAALLARVPAGAIRDAWLNGDPPPPEAAQTESRRILAHLAFARLIADRVAGGEHGVPLVRLARRWLQPDDGPIYAALLVAFSTAALAHNDLDAAERYARAIAATPGGRYLVQRTALLVTTTTIHYLRGATAIARHNSQQCLQLLERHQLRHGTLGARAYALLGREAYDRDEIDRAITLLEAGHTARWQWWEAETAIPTTLLLAMAYSLRELPARAEAALQQTEQLVRDQLALRAHNPGFVAVLELCRLKVALARADADTRAIARDWLADRSTGELRQRYAATLPILQELADLALARALTHAGRAAEACLLLAQLAVETQAEGRLRAFWETQVLLALALLAEGDEATAVATLATVLPAIVHAQLPRLLLDEGAPAAALLAQIVERRLLSQTTHASAVAWLAAFPATQRPDVLPRAALSAPAGDAPPELLSERELQILQLLADGADTRAIAAAIFVAESTVKWHIRNLCGKLQVRTRLQALARARHQGLIR